MTNPYVVLAKKATETYVKEGKVLSLPKDLPKNFISKKAGVFVTIMKGNKLRGCIGTYTPTKSNLADEIIHNAIAAASSDFRFDPIFVRELPELTYHVYVLEKPKPIKSIKELDPKKYGVLIRSETGKSGLLLPDLDGIDTVEKQLRAVCMKCQVVPEKKVVICKFKAKKYH